MAEQCYMMEEQAFLSEAYIVARTAVVADQVRVLDALVGIVRGQTISDTLTVGEAYDGQRAQWVRDTLTVGEQYMLLAHPDEVLSDRARLSDGFSITRSAAWADTLVAGEAYSIATSAMLSDSMQVLDGLIPLAHPVVMVGDSVRVADRLLQAWSADIADSVMVAEAWTFGRSAILSESVATSEQYLPLAHPVVVLADSAAVAEALFLHRIARVTLSDSMQVSESYSAHLAARAMLGDEVFVDERYMLPAALVSTGGHTAHRVGAATAWTANTDTWGMSRYTDTAFNSLAVVDGVLMGANDAGLWRLDAQDDAGEPILAHVQTDMQDYGAEQVKSAPLVYAGAATDGALQLTVDAVIKGAPAFYTYTFEPRHAGDFAPTRCKIGRGVRSRYLQFTVGNHSGSDTLDAGADFTIDQLSVLAEAGSRRV